MFYTYILQSQRDGDLYVGSTKNLRKRFEQHQKGEVFSTKGRRPFKLIYYEACLNEDDAYRREKSLKTFRGKMTIRRRLKSFFTGSSNNYPQLKIAAARAVAVILISAFALTSMFSALSFPKEARAAATISKTLTRPINEIGLVGWWTFDGPDMLTNVADKSGQGNNGTLVNMSTTTAPGRVGQSLSFPAPPTGAKVMVPTSSSLNDLPALSVSLWLKWENASTPAGSRWGLVSKYDDNVGGHGWMLLFSASGGDLALWANFATTDLVVSANTNITRGAWRHVVLTWDGSVNSSGAHIYVDGVEASYNAPTEGVGAYVTDASRSLSIGNGRDNADHEFTGPIDDVRIYNRALSAAEVTRLYQLGATSKISKTLQGRDSLTSGLVGWWTFDGPDMLTNVADKSGQNDNGNLIHSGSGTTTAPGKVGQALTFDGINDYVTLGASYNGVQSVSFWIKVATSTTLQKILDLNGTATVTIDSGTLNGNNFTSPTRYVDGAAASAINDTNWHHVAITTGTGINASAMDIGRISAAYLGGSIDDVRIYSLALSAAEVLQLYNLGR